MITDMMIGRRRLLTLTAAGVSAITLGSAGSRQAKAAESVRWVSPRGTIEVLDDYPYWVAKKFGYFGDIETTLEPGPSDATATVKLVDQNQADVGYPSPGVFSLGLSQGMPLVSVFHMGGEYRWWSLPATCVSGGSVDLESLTALVEHHDGRLEIIDRSATAQHRSTSPTNIDSAPESLRSTFPTKSGP